jgi:natural product biosynthesis luciferase-like monooxygenase protein
MRIDEYITSLRKNNNIIIQVSDDELKIKAPKEALTKEIVEDIRRRKPEILGFFKNVNRKDNVVIEAAQQKEFYKLTSAQKRLFFLYEFDKASLSYNTPYAARLKGQLDAERLTSAFEKLIQRHESLRTSFAMEAGEPVQKIADAVPFAIESFEAAETGIDSIIQKFIRPFNLGAAPLMHVGLIKLHEDEHLLLLDMHHIITDGVSEGIFIRDFLSLYNGDNLPALKLQYKDFAEWQQSAEQQRRIAEQKAFWLEAFKEPVHTLQLPADFERPAIKGSEGAMLKIELSTEETRELQALAEKENATLFMVLLSIYNIFLSKLGNQEDIVIGTPVAGRLHDDLQEMIGIFVNVLPLRNSPKGEVGFNDFLADVRSNALACFDNQAYPYEELIDELQVERDTSRNPLFDVAFAYQNMNMEALAISGLTLTPYDKGHTVAKFDLSLEVLESNDKLQLNFEYSQVLFKRSTAERFVNYFRKILSTVVNDPHVLLSDIEMLPAQEKNRLLFEFNDTDGDYQKETTVVSLFEKQAKLDAHATAVVYEGRSLSYASLNRQANQVAHCLREKHSVNRGELVAIIAERSERMLIGLLGILKSGAAYLPIDPAYPAERIAYMLEDSEAAVLLACEPLQQQVSGNAAVVQLQDAVNFSTEDPLHVNEPGDLCYIIYTSGSTGKPKGVMVLHYNVVNFMAAMSDRLVTKQDDCMLAVTSTSFDISVLELFWTLCNGTQVVIHPADISLSSLDRYVATEDLSVDFSLFFFSSYNNEEKDKYHLLLESVKYADEAGFNAVWTPERHFHEFGGLYPNPSVTSAALAMITKKIELRSGSVVSPLHDAVRIAEEWSVVDNLSNGRVALSFASGWNPDDFILAKNAFKSRAAAMYAQIETIKKLWRGETITRENGLGKETEVRVYPVPVQKELPVWITSSGNEETFKSAGAIGANLLTHLLGQDVEELGRKIKLYKEARAQHGFDGATGKVAVMLHTFIGDDVDEIESIVEKPFTEYLKSAIGLSKMLFEEAGLQGQDVLEEKMDILLKNAFKRYYQTSSLIGTRSKCSEMVLKLKEIGVDEIACLVDFGVEETKVLDALRHLKELKELFARKTNALHKPITMMQSTPSFIKLSSEGAHSKKFLQSLNTLLLGGEAVPAALVRKLSTETGAEMYNMYGPTETTVWSCMQKLDGNAQKVSVGKPVLNTQLYILDRHLKPVPAGVAGDLYIAGEGVAAGYWKRPELSAEKFMQNPFGKSGKMYSTGDVARWQDDGTIELLGRQDQQVKIRGHRIETGEIESVLSSYELIRSAVVAANEKEGEKYLAAYYVSDQVVESSKLRTYLSGKLPDYMIPSFFVQLKAMPLTPNGKLDRRHLPDPELSLGDDYVPPSTDMEEALVEIWSEVLGLQKQRISLNKSFFDLGGNSLKILRLHALMNERLNWEITIPEMFRYSTISSLIGFMNGKDIKVDQYKQEVADEVTGMHSLFSILQDN